MEKRVGLSMLCDLYGALLTESRLKTLRLYCEEDLTLQEIAEQTGITRQGVSDAIRHAEKQLEQYEEKLGFLARYRALREDVALCRESLRGVAGAEKAEQILDRMDWFGR